MSAVKQITPEAIQVVAKALRSLKTDLDISNEVLGNIIGLNSSTVSRLINSGTMRSGKPYEAGVLLLRVYRSLYALLGGNIDQMKHWLNTDNDHIHGKPVELMKSTVGLVEIVKYLDAMRGRA